MQLFPKAYALAESNPDFDIDHINFYMYYIDDVMYPPCIVYIIEHVCIENIFK
jgi:hypothetical protein